MRKDVIAGSGLPLEEVTDILSSIAHMNSFKTWELNLPPDEDFIRKYPEIVRNESLFWKNNESLFTAMENRHNIKHTLTDEIRSLPAKKRKKSTVNKQ